MAKYRLENLIIQTDEIKNIESKDKEQVIRENLIGNLYPEDIKAKGNIVELEVSRLKDNENNYFSKMKGEQFEEFKASIKQYGILTPLIVRKVDTSYEILAGHNRKNAAIELGMNKVPAIITDYDDVDASIVVAMTNNQREDTTEIEWARSYRTTYDILKRQAGRKKKNDDINGGQNDHNSEDTINSTDNNNEINSCQSGNHLKEEINIEKFDSEINSCQSGNHLKEEINIEKFDSEINSCQSGNHFKTEDIVAEKYGISKRTLHRKIRLAYLTEQLAEFYLKKKINQEQAINLSYLKEDEQVFVGFALDDKMKITNEIAEELRRASESLKEGILSTEDVFNIIKSKTAREVDIEKPMKVKRYKIEDIYFPKTIKQKEKETYITKALSYILENNISL